MEKKVKNGQKWSKMVKNGQKSRFWGVFRKMGTTGHFLGTTVIAFEVLGGQISDTNPKNHIRTTAMSFWSNDGGPQFTIPVTFFPIQN